MKRLLATTAIALVAMASTASAQSVLERVLAQIDNGTNLAQVNGTFANIAENLGGDTTAYLDGNGDIISDDVYAAALVAQTATFGALTVPNTTTVPTNVDYTGPSAASDITPAAAAALAASDAAAALAATYVAVTVPGGGIDGSITNIIDGITDSTQTAVAGSVSAIEYNMPTLNFGNMATTALGAVNTGDITLGVNSTIDNAKTSSTEALSVAMAQLGGGADTGAIVLNIASNMTGVNGSISNTMTEVNGTVGALSTTALGAVNTGTIISGVNAAVSGITGASAGQSGL